MAETTACALILLAAGESRRMERPKQLLPIGGKPLLRHVVEAALDSPVAPVIVVLGAHAEEVGLSLHGLAVQRVVNPGWAEGMGSSLRMGMETLASLAPRLQGIVVALADQPGFTSDHVRRLLDIHRATGRPIVASRCAGQLMPPAFFAASYFPELRGMSGEAGARALFQRHADELATMETDELLDLDTPEDYANYLRMAQDKRLPRDR